MGSWIWRKLLKYRGLAKPYHKVEVHNGENTSFWYDSWSRFGCLFDIVGSRGFIAFGISSSSTLAEVFSTHRRRRHRLSLFNEIEDEIQKRLLQQTAQRDVALWRRKGDTFQPQFYSRDMRSQVRQGGQVKDWYKGVWFPQATPKFSFIVWLATLDRLSTGDRMSRWSRGNGANFGCVFCDCMLESRDHLFFTCRFTSHVWLSTCGGLTQQRHVTSFLDILTLVSGTTLSGTQQFLIRYAFHSTLYTIWRERNRRRHGELASSADLLIKTVDITVRHRCLLVMGEHNRMLEPALRDWFGTRTPPQDVGNLQHF